MIVAIDIGGTQMRVSFVDNDFDLLTRHSLPTGPHSDPFDLFGQISQIIKSDMKSNFDWTPDGFGVSAPSVDKRNGRFVNPPNLPLWDGFSIFEFIEAEFSVPVYVGNDASLAALAEHRLGSGKGVENMLYFTLSTGVGGGIIVDGKLYEGSTGFAGEFGHISVNHLGPTCNCGNRGCLEAYVSGPAIVRQFIEERAKGGTSYLPVDCVPTTADIFDASSKGDSLSADIIERAARYLGIGIVTVMHSFEPECIVIGGGVSASLDQLKPYIHQHVEQNAMAHFNGDIDVRRAAFNEDSSLLGAACYFQYKNLGS